MLDINNLEYKIESSENVSKSLTLKHNKMSNNIEEEVLKHQLNRKTNINNDLIEVYNGDLIVDDISSNRLVLSRILKLLNVKTESAQNGLEALDMVSKKNYRIVWMDVKMPLLDGIKASEIMRTKLDYDGKVCAVTAFSDMYTTDQCLKAGINHILNKPISVRIIKEMSEKITKT